VPVAALAVPAAAGAELALVAEIQQRVELAGADEHHVAALAAVAAAGAAARDEFLPPEGDAAVAAGAGPDLDGGVIDEHDPINHLKKKKYRRSACISF